MSVVIVGNQDVSAELMINIWHSIAHYALKICINMIHMAVSSLITAG